MEVIWEPFWKVEAGIDRLSGQQKTGAKCELRRLHSTYWRLRGQVRDIAPNVDLSKVDLKYVDLLDELANTLRQC
jgi:hypothetical protein